MYTSRKSMSQFCLKFVYRNLDTLRPFCIHPLIVVLDVLETQNFTGLLLISIQTNPTWFGTNPGNFWKMFIFVHFVHSEAQELSAGCYPVLLSSFQPYSSSWTTIRPHRPCIHPVNRCPNFVSICIQKYGYSETSLISMWCDGSMNYRFCGTSCFHVLKQFWRKEWLGFESRFYKYNRKLYR